MNIKIKENIYVESDGRQFIVKEYTGKPYQDKDGNERNPYKALGYYGNIEQLLYGLINKEIHNSNATTLDELLNDAERIKNDVKRLVKGELS